MSDYIERLIAVWRMRDDLLHTMECGNCGAEARYQIVDGVWRYEPYCAHCGARVYKQEDLPMSKQPDTVDASLPFVCQQLGILPEQPFVANGYPDRTFPVLVYQGGQIRRYIPGSRNKGHKLGGGAVCWLMEHPEAVTMRQEPITDNNPNEEDDMNETKKPRLAEILGVEVGEKFSIDGRQYNPYCVSQDGYLLDKNGDVNYEGVTYLLNHPECLHRIPRWTEQEIEDAKALLRMFPRARYIVNYSEGDMCVYDAEYIIMSLPEGLFPSLKLGESVKLADIIGGVE